MLEGPGPCDSVLAVGIATHCDECSEALPPGGLDEVLERYNADYAG